PMIDLHGEVFQSDRGAQLLSPSIPPDALRDMPDSHHLPPLLPETIEHAFRHEQALIEPPRPTDPDRPRPPAQEHISSSTRHPEPETPREGHMLHE
ncbi:MAG: hypothetical protein AAFX99_36500, partial [Myxococcota bacterium]